jgi:methylmalonyl-CoA/ethylmalonyl-CoA epimerase
MAKQIRLMFPGSDVLAIATLVEKDAPETCEYIWQLLEQPLNATVEMDHSAGGELTLAVPPVSGISSENITVFPVPGDLLFFQSSGALPKGEKTFSIGICYRRGAKGLRPTGWISGNVFAAVTQNLEGLQQVVRDVIEKGPQPLRIERIPQPQLPWMKDGIIQVAIVVPDLDQAVENYWKLCAIGPWRIYNYGKPPLKMSAYRGEPSDCRWRIALAWVGPLCIELIEAKQGENVYTEFVKEHGYGLHHLAVSVEDMPTAIAQAASVGAELVQEGSGHGLDGSGHFAYVDATRTLGTIIELVQYPKVRVPPERIYPS